MKKLRYKRQFFGVILCIVLAAACSNEAEPHQQEVVKQEAVSLFSDYTQLQKISLVGEDEVTLEATKEGWVESNGNEIDQSETNRLLTAFVELTGTMIEADELEKIETSEPFLTVTLMNNNQEEKRVEMIEAENGVFYAKESEEQVYTVSQLPEEWQQFSLVMLQSPLDLPIETLKEIRYTNGESTIVLNEETTLSEVETSPFISGWFLHSDLQTEFSVEYTKMEQLLTTLSSLKAKESEAVEEEAFKNPTQIELIGTDEQEALVIGSTIDGEPYTYVKTESDQSIYQVPNVLIRKLDWQPIEIVDNFISLLPLTAIESIEIIDGNDKTMIEAKHEVVENAEEELEVDSEFYVNDEKVDTGAFRKTYQYLAMLSYEEETEDYVIPEEEVEGEIQLVYTFKDNGETLQHTIRFIPHSKEKYVVVKNGIAEWMTSSEQIDSMLHQLSLITIH